MIFIKIKKLHFRIPKDLGAEYFSRIPLFLANEFTFHLNIKHIFTHSFYSILEPGMTRIMCIHY